jgi:hypothetical protein
MNTALGTQQHRAHCHRVAFHPRDHEDPAVINNAVRRFSDSTIAPLASFSATWAAFYRYREAAGFAPKPTSPLEGIMIVFQLSGPRRENASSTE